MFNISLYVIQCFLLTEIVSERKYLQRCMTTNVKDNVTLMSGRSCLSMFVCESP
jgi:hypothetical protein